MNYDEMILRDKINVLQEHNSSEEILDSLKSYVEGWICDQTNFSVLENPFAYNVEILQKVLQDLAQYTELNRCDSDIPDDLQYISEFLDDV